MKEKPTKSGIVPTEDPTPPKKLWYASLSAKEIVDILPIMTHSKGQKIRLQIPIHEATETLATKIREKYPQKFRINLDVYKSMLYAGRQLFDYVFLGHLEDVQKSKGYKMAKTMASIDNVFYDSSFVEEFLKKLLEGHLTHGEGIFSRESIIAKIEEIRPLISEELQSRCDIFIDEELDSEIVKARVKERLKKRNYRKNKKNIHLVES